MEKVANNPPLYQHTPDCERKLEVQVRAMLGGAAGGDANGDEPPKDQEEQPDQQNQRKPSDVILVARNLNCFILDDKQELPTEMDWPIGSRMSACKPLIIDGYRVGLITPTVFQKLVEYPDVFACSEEDVRLAPHLKDYESRSNAINVVLENFKAQDTFVTLKGWRDECFEVRVDMESNSVLKMERAATCLFGCRQYGVDINGFVNHPDKGFCMWLQRRSMTKQRWPGKWDNMVGGGLAVGYSILETAHKEAFEEASIPEEILRNLEPAGCCSIFFESERGLSPNTEFVFDLEVPFDFQPKNLDGEVADFQLFSIQEVIDLVLSTRFKTTSCPVVLDFMVRRGFINAENEPDLEVLQKLLHVPLTSYYKKLENDTENRDA